MIEVGGQQVHVFDAQIHLWPTEGEAAWLDPENPHRGAKAPTVEGLMAEMDEAGVDRAILVPPNFVPVGNEFAIDVSRQHPDRFATMAKIARSDHPEIEQLFSLPEVLGFRVTFARGPAIAWLTDGTAEWFWEAAASIGAPVMAYTPGRVAELLPILERHPGLRLIIDHGGLPSTAPPLPMEAIVSQAIPLASFPNVAIKVTAFPCATDEPYPFPMAQRSVRILVDAFGADRVFWGSDLTRLPCTYAEDVRFLTGPGALTTDELSAVMGGGLARFLGW